MSASAAVLGSAAVAAAHGGGDDEDGQQEAGERAAASSAPSRGRELGGVAGCERVLGRACEHLEGEAVVADDEEAVPAGAAEQVALLAVGEPERLGDPVDRLRGLAEQDLAGGVADDRLAEFGREQVAGVLGDRGQAAPAFAGALGEPVQEARRRRVRA